MTRKLSILCLVATLGCGTDDATPRARAQQIGPPRPTPVPAPLEIPPSGERALVKLVVLGAFPDDLAAAVEQGLRDELQVAVERIDGVPLPRSAYYAPRRRYRADRLLEHMNARLAGEPATTRVLGLTSVDISTTKPPHRDWGVFGLGELGGRSCVISTYRLRRRARDEARPTTMRGPRPLRGHPARSSSRRVPRPLDELLTFRVVTTAVHEVGHTLGLPHCVEPGCVMRDAEGSIQTVDTSTGHLGPECRREIDRESPRLGAGALTAGADRGS